MSSPQVISRSRAARVNGHDRAGRVNAYDLPSELSMRFATTSDGVRNAYRIVGEGPTCVFCWSPQVSHNQLAWRLFPGTFPPLAERLRLVLFDWRNTGLSGATEEGVTPEAGRRDLEAVVDAVAPGERVSFIACCGAPFAVVPYVAANPDRVDRMVIFCACVRGDGYPRSSRSWHDLVDEEPDVALKLCSGAARGWSADPNTVLEQYLAAAAPLAYQSQVEDRMLGWDVSSYLPLVECPVLVIQRRALPRPTLAEAADTAAALPHGELIVLEGDGYLFAGGEDPRPAMLQFLAPGLAAGDEEGWPVDARIAPLGGLTERERDVLRLVTRGLSSREVAECLVLSVRTVERHISSVYSKLGIHSRAQLMALLMDGATAPSD